MLAHLRACGDVWGGCILRMLAEDVPTIRAVNPRTHIGTTDDGQRGWVDHLAAFTADRAELLGVLQGLAPAEWERSAHVVGARRLVQRTVLTYAEGLASHERPHVSQVERAAATGAGCGDHLHSAGRLDHHFTAVHRACCSNTGSSRMRHG